MLLKNDLIVNKFKECHKSYGENIKKSKSNSQGNCVILHDL